MRNGIRQAVLFLFAAIFVSGAGLTGHTGNAPAFPSSPSHRYVIHYPMRGPHDGRRLGAWLNRAGFDVAGLNWRKGEIEVITTEKGIRFLDARGIKGRVVARHVPGAEALKIDDRYLNPEKVEKRLKALHEAFPDKTRLEEIGRSNQGRPIWALLISSTPKADDPRALEKPAILFDGMHHAREIMTSEIVMDVAENLLKGLAHENRRVEQALDEWNVWIVPMLNVDGNNIVWTSNTWWRKNARADQSEVFGVDINRNYPYRWGDCNGSSGSRGAENYRGESAGSEPESQALGRLAEKVLPVASISYHSYSELVLYPFGCSGDLTGENALVERVGRELAERLPSDSAGDFYTPGAPWQILYSVDGDSMSYLFAAFGTLAFTFEVNQEFQPSYDLREPTLRKHRVAWHYFLDRIGGNLLGVRVLDGTTGKPVRAQLAVNTIEHKHGEKPFRSNEAGWFFKVLDPGAYVVAARLEDGRVGELKVAMSGHSQRVDLVVR